MARWDSCNILQAGPDASRVWQFNKNFSLNREQASRAGESLPPNLVGKSWSTLWQKKLNVAWLPPEHVFIRAAQFPPSTPAETRTMVELQLEKLSPIPVTQAVWSMHILPQSAGGLQTVVVIIAERSVVEQFLGKLEGQGFMADRLELPMLDQLQATASTGDGAWIYPEAAGGKNSALVAWWYGGALQSVGLITLAAGENRVASLKDQLTHMAWAGELEGWLTSPPDWHLVADPAIAGEWESPLREGLGTSVKIVAPVSGTELAARTAKRAAESDGHANMLPPEFARRYQQQFVDRLWMRGLGAVLGVYLVGCLIYFVAVQVLSYQTTNVEEKVADKGLSYTNALQLKARYGVLLDRQALKFAALDCWEAVAEKIPSGVTLDSMNFNDGKRLLLNGNASASLVNDVIDFSGNVRKTTTAQGQPLFNLTGGDAFSSKVNNNMVQWSFGLELKKGEAD
jgi:hypothetical protein